MVEPHYSHRTYRLFFVVMPCYVGNGNCLQNKKQIKNVNRNNNLVVLVHKFTIGNENDIFVQAVVQTTKCDIC